MRQPVVFIVDDEPSVADVTTEALCVLPCEIHAFHDSLSALEAARTVPPAVLVTDFRMPNMNGLELAAKVREINPMSEVLLLSGHATEAAEANDRVQKIRFFQKPLSVSDLIEHVRALLNDLTQRNSNKG